MISKCQTKTFDSPKKYYFLGEAKVFVSFLLENQSFLFKKKFFRQYIVLVLNYIF